MREALARVARHVSDHRDSPRNRVPRMAWAVTLKGYCLMVDVIDEVGSPTGGTVFFGKDAPTQMWWEAAQLVPDEASIPTIVGNLYRDIAAKLLEPTA